MDKVKLVFGTYNSQPAGADDYQFEKAYQEAYKPFLTVLYNFPKTRVVLYYSGILLEWFERHHPEFLMLLNEMVKRRQVELLGGGYYDPILPMIPTHDRIGQIELLTTFIRKNFGKRPRGSWVTQQIWDPSLAYMFSSSGMDYLFLDDKHIYNAGGTEDDLYEPCITEDQGKTINVFPVSSRLNTLIPEKEPEEVIQKILTLPPNSSERIITVLEPGENYGLYGESGKRCYQDNWFEKFFSLLIEYEDKIDMNKPGSINRSFVPKNKFYFPCNSFYTENNANTGYFRQVLTKYYESNLLYSKMIYTNILVNQIRGDKYRKKTAREELWKGQCNNAYWHGNPHGIYSNNLRKSAYMALIEAEKVTHEKGIFIPSIISVDFDMDGRKEYLYQGNELNAYVHEAGGMLFELDYLPKSWNYLDSMARYEEEYYKDFNYQQACVDTYPRKAFIDHFFDKTDTIDAFNSNKYRELGSFIHTRNELVDFDRERKKITLMSLGGVRLEKTIHPLTVKKTYMFNKNRIDVRYVIINEGNNDISALFGTEINFSFAAKGMESHRIYNTSKQKSIDIGIDLNEDKDVKELTIDDVTNGVSIRMEYTHPAELWLLPVETNSLGEIGLETVYQSTCFIPRWELIIPPGQTWENKITLIFNKSG